MLWIPHLHFSISPPKLNLRDNLAVTLASQPDPNSTKNHIGPVKLGKHRTLKLALSLRTDPNTDIDITHVSL